MNKSIFSFMCLKRERRSRNSSGIFIPDPEYDFGNYWVDMELLYPHINSAWNPRDALEQATNQCTQEEDFRRWRQFPTDMSLLS